MGRLLLLFCLVYILPCLLVGLAGHARKSEFWLHFFVSVFATPIGGLALLLLDRGKGDRHIRTGDGQHWDAACPGFRPDKKR